MKNSKTEADSRPVDFIVSQKQLGILRHALGLDRSKEAYRNSFVTGEGSDDYLDCEKLVGAGMMNSQRLDWVPDYIYTVTAKGKEVCLPKAG